MNPEINIRISFDGEHGNVVLQKKVGEGQEAVQVQEELEAPGVPEVISDSTESSEETQFGSLYAEDFQTPGETEFSDESDASSIPEDEFENPEVASNISAPSDEDDLLNISAPEFKENGLEVSAPSDVEDEISVSDDSIPLVPDEDMDEAIEMQIMSQLEELEAGFEKETIEFDVPESDVESDDSLNDDQIPPLPEA